MSPGAPLSPEMVPKPTRIPVLATARGKIGIGSAAPQLNGTYQ